MTKGIGQGKAAGSRGNNNLSPTRQAFKDGLNEEHSAQYAAATPQRTIILNQAQYGNTQSPKAKETQKAWEKSRREENGKAPAPSPLTSAVKIAG